jgi:hypothetical protein
MTVIRRNTPSGYTIFCDDVRQESNGKLIYIGVYEVKMILEQIPATLPSFCVVVKYIERHGESDLPVVLKVFLPGYEEPMQSELPLKEIRAAELPEAMEDPLLTTSVHIKIAPFVIGVEGMIKVRAYRGEDEIRLGTLHVTVGKIENLVGRT